MKNLKEIEEIKIDPFGDNRIAVGQCKLHLIASKCWKTQHGNICDDHKNPIRCR